MTAACQLYSSCALTSEQGIEPWDTDFVCVLVVQRVMVLVCQWKNIKVITGGVASVSAASRSSLGSVEPRYNGRTCVVGTVGWLRYFC